MKFPYLFLLTIIPFCLPTLCISQAPTLVQMENRDYGDKHFGLELAHFSNFEELNKHLLKYEQKGIQNLMLHYFFVKEDEMEFQLIAGPFSEKEAHRQKRKWKKQKINSTMVDLKKIKIVKP